MKTTSKKIKNEDDLKKLKPKLTPPLLTRLNPFLGLAQLSKIY